MTQERISDVKKGKTLKPKEHKIPKKRHAEGSEPTASSLIHLQRQVGNQAVQRMLIQRRGDGAFELDDDTAERINQARGGGQALDSAVQAQMGETMGHDFSGVRVHTSPEADALNQQLSAKAFTTGQDVFFKQGEYNPGSSSGRELIAHELTHVVQQSSGQVGGGGGRMTVNPPNDAFEQEADSIAKQATGTAAQVQRQLEEEEEPIQAKAIQRQLEEEEEPIQAKALQRQDIPEEEEPIQEKALQRQDIPEEEEPIQEKAIQRQEEIPEEEV